MPLPAPPGKLPGGARRDCIQANQMEQDCWSSRLEFQSVGETYIRGFGHAASGDGMSGEEKKWEALRTI